MAKQGDPQFDKLLQQKLNAQIVPAPEELWSSIANDLDQIKQEDAQLDQSLQKQFSNFDRKAPVGLWTAIEGELGDSPILDENALLDKKIRESYQQPNSAPEQIWYNIDQQLNVDTIWKDMQPGLNQLRKGYLWRKRLRQLSMAAVFLLLIRGCGLNFLPELPSLNSGKFRQQTAESEVPKENSKQTSSSNKKEAAFTLPAARQLFPNASKAIESVKHPKSQTPTLSKEQNQYNILSSKEQNISSPDILKEEKPEVAKVEFSFVYAQQERNSVLDQKEIPAISPSALETKEDAQLLPIVIVPAPSSTPTFNAYQEIGLIAGLQHSLILNDATPKSLRLQSASAVRKEILPAASYGLNIDHHFHPRQAVGFELWWNSNIRHKYNYAYRGKQLGAEIKLRYVKAALTYELNVLDYSFLKSQQKLLLRVGAYVANLQEQTQSSSAYQSNLPLPELQDWDSGLLLGLEQKHQLHPRIAFSYGFRSEIGITSILEVSKANNQRPSFLNLGGIARLSYRL